MHKSVEFSCGSNEFFITLFFLYKNLFYKNVDAEINQNFKNIPSSRVS